MDLRTGVRGLASLRTIAIALGVGLLFNSTAIAAPTDTQSSDTGREQGRKLFERNCSHCHGDDARGDEGPNLYNLKLGDAKIAKRIKEGIKGEMPRFENKLNDEDIKALIAYLRSLKD